MVILGLIWMFLNFQKQSHHCHFKSQHLQLRVFNAWVSFTWHTTELLNAVAKAVPAVSGILIQFPLYGSIAFIMTQALNSQDLSLSHYIAEFFVSIASKETFAIVMGIYSAVLGFLYLQVVENGLLKPHMLCKQQMI